MAKFTLPLCENRREHKSRLINDRRLRTDVDELCESYDPEDRADMRSGMTRYSSKSADLRRAFYVKRATNPRDETTITYETHEVSSSYTRNFCAYIKAIEINVVYFYKIKIFFNDRKNS